MRYGANYLQCCVLILTTYLKRKCQCRPEDCIDLLDEMGTLMNLSKVENPASELTSKYLREKEHYILIRVIREENSEATCYESLLEDLEKHYPDLTVSKVGSALRSACKGQVTNTAGEDMTLEGVGHSTDQLQQLSAQTQRTDQWRKGSLQRRAQPHTNTQLRNRTTLKSKRSSKLKTKHS